MEATSSTGTSSIAQITSQTIPAFSQFNPSFHAPAPMSYTLPATGGVPLMFSNLMFPNLPSLAPFVANRTAEALLLSLTSAAAIAPGATTVPVSSVSTRSDTATDLIEPPFGADSPHAKHIPLDPLSSLAETALSSAPFANCSLTEKTNQADAAAAPPSSLHAGGIVQAGTQHTQPAVSRSQLTALEGHGARGLVPFTPASLSALLPAAHTRFPAPPNTLSSLSHPPVDCAPDHPREKLKRKTGRAHSAYDLGPMYPSASLSSPSSSPPQHTQRLKTRHMHSASLSSLPFPVPTASSSLSSPLSSPLPAPYARAPAPLAFSLPDAAPLPPGALGPITYTLVRPQHGRRPPAPESPPHSPPRKPRLGIENQLEELAKSDKILAEAIRKLEQQKEDRRKKAAAKSAQAETNILSGTIYEESADLPPSPVPPWYSPTSVSAHERKTLPEFFDGSVPWLDPDRYATMRDWMIVLYRSNPRIYLSVTTCRRAFTVDFASIYRLHAFLEKEGLINFRVDDDTRPFDIAEL